MRAALALLVAFLAACGSPPRSFTDRYAEARQALREGDLPRALSLAEAGATAARDAPIEKHTFRLLAAELRLMRREIDEARAILAEPVPAGADAAHLGARRQYLEGYERIARGRLDEAVVALEKAMSDATARGAVDVALAAAPLLGQALYRLNRPEAADRVLMGALDQARTTPDGHDDGAVLLTLGMGRVTRSRFDEALSYFERVLALQALERDMVYAAALSNAGICYARLGEFDKAIGVQTRAVAAHEARAVPLYVEQSLGELGNTYSIAGDPARALPYLERARRLALDAGRRADAALWTDNLAIAKVSLGAWTEAEALNDEAERLKRASGDSSFVHNAITRARIFAGRGDRRRAIDAFRATLADPTAPASVLWQAHAGLAETLFADGDRRGGLAAFERALAVIEEARADLERPEHRVSFLSRLIDFHQSYVEALVTMGDIRRALEIADVSRARVLAERTDGARPRRITAAELTRHAGQSGATFVSYWIAPGRSHAWVVTAAGVRHVALPDAATVGALVSRHRQFVEMSLADPLAAAGSPSDALAAAVLEPIRATLTPGANVVIVPDGALHGVNFETLPVGSPRHYWIDEATVAIAPSLSLALRADRRRAPARPAVLLVGDAVATAGGGPQLQFARAELDAIAQGFANVRTAIYRAADARPRAYFDAQPAQFSIIHFAAHATASALSPLESAIELSADANGQWKLYARDIAAAPIAADLVTISACRGVGDRTYSGEGPVGLAWAFMRAGATRVIAGIWDVDDRSTAAIMSGLYAGLAAGKSPQAALRDAKRALIRAGGTSAKPYYWGALQVYTTRF